MVKSNQIIIVPETHWDREWYLPFQEFRARLVIMMDKLLKILNENEKYTNFTLDGQTIPIEDYLEVKPEKENEIKKHVKEGRLSIGPMYILPDEFLISGESLIRNLLIGHDIAKKYGRVMKAGYIPDPFGHIAQLPQILSGFEINSVIFRRGFGNEFEDKKLNMEFWWEAPSNAAKILGIHLIFGYGSVADISVEKKDGQYKAALRKIKRVVSSFENYTATPIVLLNSGSDHHEARPEIPEIVEQWNQLHPDKKMVQQDFEYYVKKVLESNANLNTFQGELRGARFDYILTGVLSSRMWIKQRNTKIEYLYEKYAEPLSTIVWCLDKHDKFQYPYHYLLTGFKWLIKNHPHDSICGCSIDQVHDEMHTRFDWAEQIGNEVFKNAVLYFTKLIGVKLSKNRIPLFVFNPLPFERKDIAEFYCIVPEKDLKGYKPSNFKLVNSKGEEIPFQFWSVDGEPRYTRINSLWFKCSFLASIPPCGYEIYYLEKKETETNDELKTEENVEKIFSLENEFYMVKVHLNGKIDVFDKESKMLLENVCQFEDVGDWGDEYDFSGPKENQFDLKFTSEDLNVLEIKPIINGPSHKMIKLSLNLNLPASLTKDRYGRDDYLVSNLINVYISLYENIKRVDFKIELENNSKDHRIRVLFPTNIKTDKVNADGHFCVNERDIKLPLADKWTQKPRGTNHQKDFMAVSDSSKTVAILNRGLPEYEALLDKDGNVILAITLLRCVGWLSRGDFESRRTDAGPSLYTPGAQCIGKHKFDLSLVTSNENNWISAKIHVKGKSFNNPLKISFPTMIKTPLRADDKIFLSSYGLLEIFSSQHEEKVQPYLPLKHGFLEIDNDNIQLSILKKAEHNNDLIIRLYNISSQKQQCKINFSEFLTIKNAQIVNLLEETPKMEIKAKILAINENFIEIDLDPNVICTLKIDLGK
ncbi:MAG: alpha-mannosidase [Promethearchaeota archaeon]